MNKNKAQKANDASSWFMECLHDCMIHDVLWLASSSFDWLEKVDFHSVSREIDRQTDQLTDWPSYREAGIHLNIYSGLFMAFFGSQLIGANVLDRGEKENRCISHP